jgi:uncharacterized protein
MTAVHTAPAPAHDFTRTQRPRRRWPVVLLVMTALAAGLVALRGGGAVHDAAVEPLDDAVAGTYALDDGRQLTLWGSARSPRFELDNRVTQLMAQGADRYAAMDGAETMTVRRDSTGTVIHLELRTEAGQTVAVPAILYRERPVSFASADVDLAGTLLLPTGAGPHAAVVIVHGAERDASRESYRLLGSHFARRGIATLIYDKRGVGASTGDWFQATFDDLTADALAAVEAVRAQPEIDPDRVGMLGFSQGGWVIAQAAQESDRIAFVASYGASGFSPVDQQAWLHGSMLAARGFDRAGMLVADRVSRMLYSSLDLVDAGIMPPIPHVPGFWFHALDLHTDSTALWEQVHQPTLLAWGALDCQVPAHDSMHALGNALRRGGNTDVTLAVLPRADHSFTLTTPCGHETGMAHHGSMHFADGYFDLGPDWIHAVTRSDRPVPSLPIADRPDTTVLDWHLDPPDPAPWYGSLVPQLAALLLLLCTFGLAATRWKTSRLVAAAGLAGLVATLTAFIAFAEIAMLGDTHARFLAGGPTVAGMSPLMTAARFVTPLSGGLALACVVSLGRQHTAMRWAMAAVGVALIAWAGYWRLLPIM